MYRYQPPKSSVWGHSLRRMPILRAKDLIRRFFDLCVAEHRFWSATLFPYEADEGIVARYERLAGGRVQGGRIANLTYEQSEACLAELLKDEALFRANEIHLSLLQQFKISKWRVGYSEPLTDSYLGISYEIWPHIETAFQFDSVDQFKQVRRVLSEIGLCVLNERHLKPVRTANNRRVQES